MTIHIPTIMYYALSHVRKELSFISLYPISSYYVPDRLHAWSFIHCLSKQLSGKKKVPMTPGRSMYAVYRRVMGVCPPTPGARQQ